MKTGLLSYRFNDQIRAPKLRVIDSTGKQLGILSREVALGEARKANLSLIEIAPGADPPVAKIVDLGKFKYQEEKRLKSQKKAKGGEVKEIRFSPFIAENDYRIRLERVKEFLGERNKVRLVVVFKRPQMGSKLFGYKLFQRVLGELGEAAAVDMQPKFLGKHLMMIISPVAKRIAKVTKEKEDAKTKK